MAPILKKTKVLTILGTRPEIIRLSAVIKELDASVEHVLVHTGQNYDYELNEIFFRDLGLRTPDYFLGAAGNSAIETIGAILPKIDEVLAKESPDAVLVLGDTNSALGMYPAKRRHIPVFHMEAGNRCFDDRVPEEINRRIVDHTSDINLVYSDRARDHLLREGLSPDRIIKTGSPLYEVLTEHHAQIEASQVLTTLGLPAGKYFVASFHREENVGSKEGIKRIASILNNLAETYNLPIVVSTHPRTRKAFDEYGVNFSNLIRLEMPLGFFDYVKLQKNAACVLSDSGTINEEASILGFPAINARESHERPEASDESVTLLSGLISERVLECVALSMKWHLAGKVPQPVLDYRVPDVSRKVVAIIIGYINFVRNNVWHEHA